MNKREFQVKWGTLLASLGATVTSLAAKENVKDITDDQWEEIDAVYGRLLEIHSEAVLGHKLVPSSKIEVRVVGNEVRGFVDGNQVYGVYTDDDRPRVSTAQAPCGTLEKSRAVVECMRRVLRRAESIISMQKG